MHPFRYLRRWLAKQGQSPERKPLPATTIPVHPRLADRDLPNLKLIGYWMWGTTRREEPRWPDIRRAVSPGWRCDEREQLVQYLRNGYPFMLTSGTCCRFECRDNYSIMSNHELTDGEWVWPRELYHHVERHAVALPEEFMTTAAARDWKPPKAEEMPAQGAAFRDFALWVQWGEQLPEVPKAPVDPDPLVLESFSAIITYPEAEDDDEQMDAFIEHVWDSVAMKYGRLCDDVVGEEYCIEHIPRRDQESIAEILLDGLHRYGLTGRVKLLFSEPDPDNWHRDRDCLVSR